MNNKNTEIKEETKYKRLTGIKYGVVTLFIELIILFIIGAIKNDMTTIVSNAFLCIWIALGVVLCNWIKFDLHINSKLKYTIIVIYMLVGVALLIIGSIALTFILVNGELSWQTIYILMGFCSFVALVFFTLHNRKLKE